VCRSEIFKLFARTCAKCDTRHGSWLRLDVNSNRIDSVVFGKSSRPSLTAGLAPKAEAESDHIVGTETATTSRNCTEHLEMEDYIAIKRDAAEWYNAARSYWMSQTGLTTLGK
jgi:hypothetical protein